MSQAQLSRSNVDAVAKYIREQEVNHAGSDFKAEFVAFAAKSLVTQIKTEIAKAIIASTGLIFCA